MASEIFNHRTPDVVLNEMKTFFSALQPDVNINEASVLYLLFQVFSFSVAQNSSLAQRFAQAAFLATAIDDDLTRLAADRGVTRKEATNSQVLLSFIRAVSGDAITIPASSTFSTDTDVGGNSFEFMNYDDLVIAADAYTTAGMAQSVLTGSVNNIDPEVITNIVSSISGLDAVTNPSSAYGAIDQENDEELRARVQDLLTNNTGRITVYGYEQFLESLTGVSSALVFAASAAMPNYITAVVTTDATDDGIPTAEQIAVWTAAVNADENRAVCDVITVTAPTAVPITVTAVIDEYEASADPATVRTQVQTAIIAYINGLEPGSTVRPVNISNIIHDTAGVLDYTLSAPVANTTLTNLQKATASTATVTIS